MSGRISHLPDMTASHGTIAAASVPAFLAPYPPPSAGAGRFFAVTARETPVCAFR